MGFTSRYVKRDELPNPQNLRGRIELAGVLPDDAYISGVSKRLFSGAGVGNVGTGLDTLFSFNFPAKSFKSDNDYSRIIVVGTFGVNDDNKRLAFGFGPNTTFDTGLIDLDAHGFYIDSLFTREDATNVDVAQKIILGKFAIDSAGGITSQGGLLWANVFDSLPVNDFDTGSVNSVLVTGESATATNDNVVVTQVVIELNRI